MPPKRWEEKCLHEGLPGKYVGCNDVDVDVKSAQHRCCSRCCDAPSLLHSWRLGKAHASCCRHLHDTATFHTSIPADTWPFDSWSCYRDFGHSVCRVSVRPVWQYSHLSPTLSSSERNSGSRRCKAQWILVCFVVSAIVQIPPTSPGSPSDIWRLCPDPYASNEAADNIPIHIDNEVGPREISINNVDAIKGIHGPASVCLKGPFYDHSYPHRSLHTTRDKALHAKRRRVWDKSIAGTMPYTDESRTQSLRNRFICSSEGVRAPSPGTLSGLNLADFHNWRTSCWGYEMAQLFHFRCHWRSGFWQVIPHVKGWKVPLYPWPEWGHENLLSAFLFLFRGYSFCFSIFRWSARRERNRSDGVPAKSSKGNGYSL